MKIMDRYRRRMERLDIHAAFSGNAQRVPTPSWGQGATQLGFLIYPTYRLQLIAIIAMLLLSLYLVLYRTSMGLVVRAGIENPGMVGILGINLRRTFLLVCATAWWRRRGWLVYVVAITPDGREFMAQRLSSPCSAATALSPAPDGGIVGEIISLTSAFNSSYSEVMLYALMALLLVLRPQGLFGSEGRV